MKQKYLIQKSEGKKELIIKESAELDKEIFSLLCEQTYSGEAIEAAIARGRNALISTLRTPSMYPIGVYAARIADEVTDLFQSESQDADSRELFFDDLELLKKEQAEQELLEDDADDSVGIDDLLEDDDSDTDFDDDDIDGISYPIDADDEDDDGPEKDD